MKKTNISTVLLAAYAVIITIVATCYACQCEHLKHHHDYVPADTTYALILEPDSLPKQPQPDKPMPPIEPVNWDKFITAIAWTESRHDDNAISCKGAVGYLQLMPIYVEDVNRILGEDKYKLSDRRNRQKSIEMFNILQDHYNPEHDIDKALALHNPRAGQGYFDEIKQNYFNYLEMLN